MSHGVTGSSTEKPEDVSKAETHTNGPETGAGLGFASQGGGIGFEPASMTEAGIEGEELDIADLPTSFGQRYVDRQSQPSLHKVDLVLCPQLQTLAPYCEAGAVSEQDLAKRKGAAERKGGSREEEA